MNISEVCLRKLPIGQFIRFGVALDMDNIKHDVVIWSWPDWQNGFQSMRLSAFDVNTGEYITDIL